MATQAKIDGEVDFMRKLRDQLVHTNFEIEAQPFAGDADLLVRNPTSGKTVAIELKDAGDYGELPISTILPIARLAQNSLFEKFLLITFSNVPVLLSKKLKELNVEALSRPTVSQVVEKVQLALSA